MSARGEPSTAALVRLALPMAGAMAASLAGHFVVLALLAGADGEALYLRAVYTPVSLLYVAVAAALSVSMQVAAARETGRGNLPGVTRSLTGFLGTGLACYLVLGTTVVVGSSLVAELVGLTPAGASQFRAFLTAMAAVMVGTLAGELFAATLRGTGATGRGSAVSLGYLGVELVAVYALTSVAGWGIMAVPVAVALAALTSAGLGLALLRRRGIRPSLGRGLWQPAAADLLKRIGAPVAISYLVLFALNLGYVRVLSPFGPDAVAGFSLAYTLQTLVVVPGIGFGSAIAIVLNQANAAGRPDVARRVLWLGMRAAAVGYLLLTLLVVAGGDPLMAALSAHEPVVEEAQHVLGLIAPTWAFMGCTLTIAAILEETGHGVLALAGNLGWAAAVLATGWVLTAGAGDATPLYTTMAVANVVGGLTAVPFGVLLLRHGASKAARKDGPHV